MPATKRRRCSSRQTGAISSGAEPGAQSVGGRLVGASSGGGTGANPTQRGEECSCRALPSIEEATPPPSQTVDVRGQGSPGEGSAGIPRTAGDASQHTRVSSEALAAFLEAQGLEYLADRLLPRLLRSLRDEWALRAACCDSSPSPAPPSTWPFPAGIAPNTEPGAGEGSKLSVANGGNYLVPGIKEKILAGDYVDILSLKEEWPSDIKEETNKREGKHRNTLLWDKWLAGFLVYVEEMTKVYPERALGLIKHLELIHIMYTIQGRSYWIHYDEVFRKRFLIAPWLPWGVIDHVAWAEVTARPQALENIDRSLRRTVKRNICWGFNRGSCGYQPCKFDHLCSCCFGCHAFPNCPNRETLDCNSGSNHNYWNCGSSTVPFFPGGLV